MSLQVASINSGKSLRTVGSAPARIIAPASGCTFSSICFKIELIDLCNTLLSGS